MLLFQETFVKGGYYKYKVSDRVTVLALNTNLYYRFNKAIPSFHDKDDPAQQFKFMRDNLQQAKDSGEFVHIVAHIAPGGNYSHLI